MPLPTSNQIEKVRLKASQARARLQALAWLNEDSRKIILGGLLIDTAGKNERYAKVVTALILPR